MLGIGKDGMMQIVNLFLIINLLDIEFIEILKDVFVIVIYGLCGVNGVVLIIIKCGVKGKDNISFSVNFGILKVVKKLDMLDGYVYVMYRNEVVQMFNEYENVNEVILYLGIFKVDFSIGEFVYFFGLEDYWNGIYFSVNWQDEVFEIVFFQEYNLSVNGLNDKGYYVIFGNILDQSGIIYNFGYKCYLFCVNLVCKVYEWIEIGMNMSFINLLNKFVKMNFVSDGIICGVLFYLVIVLLDDEMNNVQLNWFFFNFYVYICVVKDELIMNSFFFFLFVEIILYKDLKVCQNVGFFYNINECDVYYNREIVEGKDLINGYVFKVDNWLKNLVFEMMVIYNKIFNRNYLLNVVVVFFYERGDYGNKVMVVIGFL